MAFRSDRELLGFLWSYVRNEKRQLYIVITILLINTIIAIIAPLYFRQALALIIQVSDLATANTVLVGLIIAISIYFFLSLISWVIDALQAIAVTRLNAATTRQLRLDVFSMLLQNHVSYFDQQESGDLTSTITNDVRELYDTGNAFAEVLTSMFKLLATIAMLSYFSGLLTLTAVLLMPIFFIVVLSLRTYQRRVEKIWRTNFGKVNQSFAESMRSISVSKAFNQEDPNLMAFTGLNEATFQASRRRGFAIFIQRPVGDFLRNILLICLLAVGSMQVQAGALTVASFYLFIFLMDYYYEPVRSLARNYNRFQSLFVNLERLFRIMDPKSQENVADGLSAADLRGDLAFQHVDFSYDHQIPILQDVSFAIKAGQRVALVGHTGAGKTTIASLLLRFYDLEDGSIQLDGQDLLDYNLTSLRHALSLVSQRVFLFAGTIRGNLLIGHPSATDQQIWDALDKVQARDFIEQLPEQLDTAVIEGGANLSAGERQMIAYARALLSDPRMIILDEATSAVDLYTESRIQDSTDLLLQGRTSVVIAHRLTTIVNADLIVVLEKGQVRQMGTHDNLLQQDGPYAEMYQLYFETQSAKYLERIRTSS